MPWMPPTIAKFFTYWSLTFAVFFIYVVSMLVAGLDVWDSLLEAVRKRRKDLPVLGPLDINPLKGKTVAGSLGIGPGQQPDAKRQWVLDRAVDVASRLGLAHLRILVLEDSKEHPLVHFHDGRQLRTYRVDKTWVSEARAGSIAREQQINDLLERYLASDFLGQADRRPPRTTELTREAASKTAPPPVTRPPGPSAPEQS